MSIVNQFFHFFLFCLLFCQCIFAEKYQLSIAAIFQNEAEYMKEWIDYHRSIGVEHFFLYNNNSDDNYKKVLRPYINKKLVTLIEWQSKQEENDWHNFSFKVQTDAYIDAINKTKKISKWLALIDLDEFIIPVKHRRIIECLEYLYPDVSGLCINWQCYGTSNVERCDSILKDLLYKMRWNHPWNEHCKSIVQPLHVKSCVNPHYCIFNEGHWGVDTHFNPCEGHSQQVYIDILRINHYWTRDKYFLKNVKLPRYLKWGDSIERVMKHASEMNEEFDPIMSNLLFRHN